MILFALAVFTACTPPPSVVGSWQRPGQPQVDDVAPYAFMFAADSTGTKTVAECAKGIAMGGCLKMKLTDYPITWSVDGTQLTYVDRADGRTNPVPYSLKGDQLQVGYFTYDRKK